MKIKCIAPCTMVGKLDNKDELSSVPNRVTQMLDIIYYENDKSLVFVKNRPGYKDKSVQRYFDVTQQMFLLTDKTKEILSIDKIIERIKALKEYKVLPYSVYTNGVRNIFTLNFENGDYEVLELNDEGVVLGKSTYSIDSIKDFTLVATQIKFKKKVKPKQKPQLDLDFSFNVEDEKTKFYFFHRIKYQLNIYGLWCGIGYFFSDLWYTIRNPIVKFYQRRIRGVSDQDLWDYNIYFWEEMLVRFDRMSKFYSDPNYLGCGNDVWSQQFNWHHELLKNIVARVKEEDWKDEQLKEDKKIFMNWFQNSLDRFYTD